MGVIKSSRCWQAVANKIGHTYDCVFMGVRGFKFQKDFNKVWTEY